MTEMILKGSKTQTERATSFLKGFRSYLAPPPFPKVICLLKNSNQNLQVHPVTFYSSEVLWYEMMNSTMIPSMYYFIVVHFPAGPWEYFDHGYVKIRYQKTKITGHLSFQG